MNKISSRLTDMILRYAILIIFALPNLHLFYFVFTPLTLYPVYFLLKIFYYPFLKGTTILIGEFSIELIGACIAGSAYYLLLILNLSIPKIKLQKRLKMIALAFTVFLIINILRIFIFSLVFMSGSPWFDITHKLFWYIGSTIFVVGIWFAEVKLFKIKEIPFYSDIKYIYKKSFLGKSSIKK